MTRLRAPAFALRATAGKPNLRLRAPRYGGQAESRALGFAAGALALLHLGSVWTSRWQQDIVSRPGVFCYRIVASAFRRKAA